VTVDAEPPIPRPETVTPEYLRDILFGYYERKWNPNPDVIKTVKMWENFPILVKIPDAEVSMAVTIDQGYVRSVEAGVPEEPRILVVLLADTLQRLYYDETTAAIESISGRIKFRGNEKEKRRMLAANSYLTW
jgi:hypothetical protein